MIEGRIPDEWPAQEWTEGNAAPSRLPPIHKADVGGQQLVEVRSSPRLRSVMEQSFDSPHRARWGLFHTDIHAPDSVTTCAQVLSSVGPTPSAPPCAGHIALLARRRRPAVLAIGLPRRIETTHLPSGRSVPASLPRHGLSAGAHSDEISAPQSPIASDDCTSSLGSRPGRPARFIPQLPSRDWK